MDELSLAVENLDEVSPVADEAVPFIIVPDPEGEQQVVSNSFISSLNNWSSTDVLLFLILLYLLLRDLWRFIKEGFFWLF